MEPAQIVAAEVALVEEVAAVVAQGAVGYTHKTVLALAYTWAQARQGVTQPQQPNHQLILNLSPSPRQTNRRGSSLWGAGPSKTQVTK